MYATALAGVLTLAGGALALIELEWNRNATTRTYRLMATNGALIEPEWN